MREPVSPPAPTSDSLAGIEQDLLLMIQAVFDNPHLTEHHSFFDHGGTSMQALQLQQRIQTKYGIEIKFLTLFRYPTAAKLALILLGYQHPGAAPTLFRMRPCEDPRGILAFVGTRGFKFLDYLSLAAEIDPNYDVVYLDWKDLDRDTFLRPQVDLFTEQYHTLLSDYQGTRPLVLAGICDGALIGAELISRFDPDHRPSLLILDTRAYAPDRNQLPYYKTRLKLFLSHPLKIKWQKIKKHWKIQMQKRVYLKENGSPVPETQLKSWVGGLEMRPVPTNIHLIRGEDSDVDPERTMPSLGWEELAEGNFSAALVPGGHETLFQEANVEEVGEAINSFLNTAC